jgi:uncharacterized delta-60 repeat protein
MRTSARACLALLVLQPLLCAAAPPDLDRAFGDGGVVRLPGAVLHGLALAPAGVLYAAVGETDTDRLVRLSSTGAVDAAFHVRSTPPPYHGRSFFAALATADDSRVTALEQRGAFPVCEVVARRWRADGTADATFGTGGEARVAGGLRCLVGNLAADEAGTLYTTLLNDYLCCSDTSVLRIAADGRRADSIATASAIDAILPYVHGPVAVQADGRPVILLQASSGGFAAMRMAAATPDPGFGSQGVAWVNVPGESSGSGIAVARGRILLAGTTLVEGIRHIAVARLLDDGTPDPTFGYRGVALVALAGDGALEPYVTMAVQADGKTLVAGTIGVRAGDEVSTRPVVVRLAADGTPDRRFAHRGVALPDVPTGSRSFTLLVRPSGAIVLGTVRQAGNTLETLVVQLQGGERERDVEAGEPIAVEYFHAGQQHYFLTADVRELAWLDIAPSLGWARTGRSFRVWDAAVGTAHPVCRFWSDQTFAPKSSHFYTPYVHECEALRRGTAWRFEREAFFVRLPSGPAGTGSCPEGSQPLYRAYNDGIGGAPNHRYTTDPALLDQMIAQGWIMEGEATTRVFACVPPP